MTPEDPNSIRNRPISSGLWWLTRSSAMAPQAQCPHCGNYFKALGIGSHKKSCQKKKAVEAQNQKVAAELLSDPQCTVLLSQWDAQLIDVTYVVLAPQPVPTRVVLQGADPRSGSSSMGGDSGSSSMGGDSGRHSTCSTSVVRLLI